MAQLGFEPTIPVLNGKTHRIVKGCEAVDFILVAQNECETWCVTKAKKFLGHLSVRELGSS